MHGVEPDPIAGGEVCGSRIREATINRQPMQTNGCPTVDTTKDHACLGTKQTIISVGTAPLTTTVQIRFPGSLELMGKHQK